MSKIIRFVVLGTPAGKARPKVTRNGTYTPEKTIASENAIRWEYKAACGGIKFEADSQLYMVVNAYFPIPRSASAKAKKHMMCNVIRPTKKPDWDNVGKLVSDALNQVAYYDDKQIVECMVRKFYSDRPRVEITIEEILEV